MRNNRRKIKNRKKITKEINIIRRRLIISLLLIMALILISIIIKNLVVGSEDINPPADVPTDNIHWAKSSDGVWVPVPNGYSASKISGETSVKGGFVIYEGENVFPEENVMLTTEEIIAPETTVPETTVPETTIVNLEENPVNSNKEEPSDQDKNGNSDLNDDKISSGTENVDSTENKKDENTDLKENNNSSNTPNVDTVENNEEDNTNVDSKTEDKEKILVSAEKQLYLTNESLEEPKNDDNGNKNAESDSKKNESEGQKDLENKDAINDDLDAQDLVEIPKLEIEESAPKENYELTTNNDTVLDDAVENIETYTTTTYSNEDPSGEGDISYPVAGINSLSTIGATIVYDINNNSTKVKDVYVSGAWDSTYSGSAVVIAEKIPDTTSDFKVTYVDPIKWSGISKGDLVIPKDGIMLIFIDSFMISSEIDSINVKLNDTIRVSFNYKQETQPGNTVDVNNPYGIISVYRKSISIEPIDTEIFNLQCSTNQYVWVPVNNVSELYGVDSEGKVWGKLYEYSAGERKSRNWKINDDGFFELENQLLCREPDILLGWEYESGYLNSQLNGIRQYEFLQKELEQFFYTTIESIKKYGGFYIGRYETGGLSETAVVRRMNTDLARRG